MQQRLALFLVRENVLSVLLVVRYLCRKTFIMSKFDNLYAATGKSQATKVLHAVRNAIQQTSREGLKPLPPWPSPAKACHPPVLTRCGTTMEGLQGALARLLAEANVADLVHGTQMTAAVESARSLATLVNICAARFPWELVKPNFAGLAGLNGAAQRHEGCS